MGTTHRPVDRVWSERQCLRSTLRGLDTYYQGHIALDGEVTRYWYTFQRLLAAEEDTVAEIV